MNFIKKHKTKIIILAVMVFVLLIAFFAGDAMPDKNNTEAGTKAVGQTLKKEDTAVGGEAETHSKDSELNEDTSESTEEETSLSEEKAQKKDIEAKDAETETAEEYQTKEEAKMAKTGAAQNAQTEGTAKAETETAQNAQTEGTAQKVQTEETPNGQFTCTLSVDCSAVLFSMDNLKKEKRALIPEDGIIFPKQEVVFYEGESVFNVLVREMKKNKIHLEFVNTPGIGGSYIEGIANLYEFDCGELSGWKYRVNGTYPGYSCSAYKLKKGDIVEWVYALDLEDIKDGGGSA